MQKKLVIAIDGPAGAGKSTVAKSLALRLGYKYIDTGAMYRAITLLALENEIAMNNEASLTKLAQEAEISFTPLTLSENLVFLEKRNITREIRTNQVNAHVSLVSKIAGVRYALMLKQRHLAKEGGVVMDGRDIGTVVLPTADLKIFLTASLTIRADRRLAELNTKGESVDYLKIKENLETRDTIDSCRQVAPLKKAEDAYEIDTSTLTVDQVVNKITHLIQEV